MSNKLNGIGASEGIAIAEAYILDEKPIIIPKNPSTNISEELKILTNAIEKTKKDLINLQIIAKEKLGEEKALIFEAHTAILEDPALMEEINDLIKKQNYNGVHAVDVVAKKFILMFSEMEDDYFQERAADIKDVTERLMRHFLNLPVADLATISQEVIIVAEDLTPSQTAQLNPLFVKGFACNIGGRTSHAAIMARSLEIPAVLGLKTILSSVKSGDVLAIDGGTGEVEINPKDKEIWTKKAQNFKELKNNLEQYKTKKTITKDGYKDFVLEGNIGSPKDVAAVLNNGGEGIGLFRSEFLYMDNDHFPTEDEQFMAYKQVVEDMKGKITIIRTLDIGGDKKLSYFKFPEEMNPFLGYRAIRFTLDRKDIFRSQIRALLRASAFGPIGIMFPMIATIDEFKTAKQFVVECKQELVKEGVKIGNDLQIGMMVEIPAAAALAHQFAKYADFFSIGTNDLIQYSMAADRMSEHVTYLYQPYNPAILNLIKLVIDGAHKHKKWVGMCGEMAGEPEAIPLLMGLGLDAYSMSATSIPQARSIMAKLSLEETKVLATAALNCETSDEVLKLVKKVMSKIK